MAPHFPPTVDSISFQVQATSEGPLWTRLPASRHKKTEEFAESKAELQRGIENVEVSCGIPTLMQGYISRT